MSNLIAVEKNVHLLLLKYPRLRSIYQRKKAIFQYWRMFEGVTTEINENQFVKLTNPETISRAVRKVLNDYPDLRPPQATEMKRYEQAEGFRTHYQRT